ncbi:hypothetical protein VPH35_052059 [Triticum aestivum]
MYQAIPYGVGRLPRARGARRAGSRLAGAAARGDGGEAVRRAVAESLVLVVGRRGCCLSHVVADEDELTAAVAGNAGGEAVITLPAVFVGGRLLGGLDRLMAVHISGELVPILKDAGALWL